MTELASVVQTLNPETIMLSKWLSNLLREEVCIGQYSDGYEILFLDSQVEKHLGKGFLEMLRISFKLQCEDSSVVFKFEWDEHYQQSSEFKFRFRQILNLLVDNYPLEPNWKQSFLDMTKDTPLKSVKPKPIITYIVKQVDANKIKIGKSSRIEKRLKDITHNCGSPLQVLLLIPYDIEQELHLRFATLRYVGEWFIDNGDIQEWIEEFDRSGTLTEYTEKNLKK